MPAPKGNANARRHGLRGSQVREAGINGQIRAFDRLVRAELGRAPSFIQEAYLQTLKGLETKALLAWNYLRKEGEKLPLDQRLRLMDVATTARESRDRVLGQLGISLENGKSTGSVWDALKNFQPPTSPQSFSPDTSTEPAPSAEVAAGTPQTVTEKRRDDITTVPAFDPRPFPAPGEDPYQPGQSEVQL
jgi:hypothetical protein